MSNSNFTLSSTSSFCFTIVKSVHYKAIKIWGSIYIHEHNPKLIYCFNHCVHSTAPPLTVVLPYLLDNWCHKMLQLALVITMLSLWRPYQARSSPIIREYAVILLVVVRTVAMHMPFYWCSTPWLSFRGCEDLLVWIYHKITLQGKCLSFTGLFLVLRENLEKEKEMIIEYLQDYFLSMLDAFFYLFFH